MPAQRKPTAILEASGAFEANPKRARPDEPNSGRGVGPAPGHLAEDERAVWDEIVADCAAGVFQSGDRVMLEVLSCLLAEYRRDRAGFGGRKYQQLTGLLARCGMTPADRSRVTVPRGTNGEKPKVGLASFR
jgi:hypothetical protein